MGQVTRFIVWWPKEKLPKKELLRIVRTPEGEVKIDETGKLNGRGAYIKKDIAVLERIKKSDVLQKKLECNIEESVYEEIEKIIKEWGESVYDEFRRLCYWC